MRVLIALDDSVYGQAALASIINRAWWGDTEFMILSVVQTLNPAYTEWGCETEFMTMRDAEKLHMESMVSNAAVQLRGAFPNYSVGCAVEEGNICDEIIKKADAWNADLIVMGSHGRTGLSKFFLGSVAETVLHRAKCSVEIVKVAAEKVPTKDLKKEIVSAI